MGKQVVAFLAVMDIGLRCFIGYIILCTQISFARFLTYFLVFDRNELLTAVDLQFIALKDEVAVAFDQAIGGTCSTKDISGLENLYTHFGAKDIRHDFIGTKLSVLQHQAMMHL